MKTDSQSYRWEITRVSTNLETHKYHLIGMSPPVRTPADTCNGDLNCYSRDMVNLADVQKQAEELSLEEKEGLLAFLIHELPAPLSRADDEEILRREEEMDSGAVVAISHEDFLKRVGRSA